jgi:hypothetical protein
MAIQIPNDSTNIKWQYVQISNDNTNMYQMTIKYQKTIKIPNDNSTFSSLRSSKNIFPNWIFGMKICNLATPVVYIYT